MSKKNTTANNTYSLNLQGLRKKYNSKFLISMDNAFKEWILFGIAFSIIITGISI